MLTWDDCRDLFEPDGGLIDVRVFKTGISGWDELLSIARVRKGAFSIDGKSCPFPKSANEVFKNVEKGMPGISFDWDGLRVNAHFFDPDNLEVDLDPAEINSQSRLDSAVALACRLTHATGKSVLFTPENCPDNPFLEFFPGNREVKITWEGKSRVSPL